MVRRMRLLILVLALWPATVLASGLSIPDLGAHALSQGAAQVASPDDLSAVYYNPAALAAHGGIRALVDVRSVRHFLRFYRREADGSNPLEWQPVSNDGGLTTAPMFGVAWRLERPSLPKIAFAIGGHPASGYSGYSFPDPIAIRSQWGKGNRFDEDTAKQAPQRYAMIEQDSLSYTLAFAVSVEVKPWLLVGASYQNPIIRMKSRQALSLFTQDVSAEDIPYDGVLDLEAWDRFTPVGVLGATFRLPKGVDVGVSVQLPATYEADGTMNVTLPSVAEAVDARVEGNEASVMMKTPLIARLGARLRREAFEAELAFTFDGWSRYDNLVLTPRDVKVIRGENVSELKPITLTKGMHDSFSVRAGGLIRLGTFSDVLAPFSLRLGGVYDPSAVPDERISLDQAHWTRFSINTGIGMKLGRFDVVVAYAHYVQPDKTVTTSEVKQARTSHPDRATVIGNGIYQSAIDIIDASVSATF